MDQQAKTSILEMARGAIMERADYEVKRVIDNILDVNTKATEKRKITITVEFKPDDERQVIQVSAHAKSSLASTNPISTSLYVASDYNGEMQVVEMVPQIPGQTSMESAVQEEPKILKFSAM